MQLFHITCLQHFHKIWKEDGFLKTTESNIGSPEEARPDPNDPDYDEAMVPVWPLIPRYRRTESTLPMVVPGPILKKMEANGHQYPRADRSDFGDDLDENVRVSMVVGFDEDQVVEPVKFGEHVGPDVVWLTDDPTPCQKWAGLERVPDDLFMYAKDAVIFVVDAPESDTFKWSEWAFDQGISPYWYDCLDNPGDDGTMDSEHWYVTTREIPKAEWNAVYAAKSGKVLWLNPDKYPDIPAEAYLPSGLIDPQFEPTLTAQYPAPQVYKALTLRRST